MNFILSKVSDVGSANPIVARLSIQFKELVEFYNLPKDSKEQIINILSFDIKKRLLVCEGIAIDLNNEILEKITVIKEQGLKTQSHGRVVELPHIIELEERIESYLYNAKACLRDILKVYNIVFDSEFKEARYDKAIKWAAGKFGDGDPITEFLIKDHDLWGRSLVSMRNAIEHPGGYSGHLNIHNFKTNADPFNVIEPVWGLNEDDPSVIRIDLLDLVYNILELAEDVVISALDKVGKSSPMLRILEIPEDKRRKEAPIRFVMGLNQEHEFKKP